MPDALNAGNTTNKYKLPDALRNWRINDYKIAGDSKVAQVQSADDFNTRIMQNFSPHMKTSELQFLAEEWRKILFKREGHEGIFKGTPEGEDGQKSLYTKILTALESAIARSKQESQPGSAVTQDSASVTSQFEELNLSKPFLIGGHYLRARKQ
ncbi:hypothetical protein RUND412_006048 [Rhizina undulata]